MKYKCVCVSGCMRSCMCRTFLVLTNVRLYVETCIMCMCAFVHVIILFCFGWNTNLFSLILSWGQQINFWNYFSTSLEILDLNRSFYQFHFTPKTTRIRWTIIFMKHIGETRLLRRKFFQLVLVTMMHICEHQKQ